MAYSTISKPSLHFNTKLFTGNGANDNAQTGVGFQPDWTWIKARSQGYDHMLFDRVRQGSNAQPFDIRSNLTNAQSTDTSGVKSFDSDGFTLNNGGYVNGNGVTFASWNWKANGAGSANTDGSINTTATSVNTTAGFSIITYTGTGSAGTIGHGLGVKPDFWQVKALSETRAWYGWHKDLALGDKITFNESGAKTTDTSLFTTTAPTTSVINLGNSVGVNNNGITFVCYAFAEKKGFSKFGSYTGNGNADGSFIYTGFKPAFVILKIAEHSGSWLMFDNKRDGLNPNSHRVYANGSDAEDTGSGSQVDFLSNGFKCRSSDSSTNTVNNKYLYMAFAEEPLVANVCASIPATAR